jgi:hypothetical protein
LTNSEGQVKYCRCTFFGYATPDRAGARPYRVQCRVARCDMGLPAHTSHSIWRLFACFAGPRPTRRDRSNIAVAHFWTCHAGSRRSASRVQCRVARCDMASQPTPLIPFGVFSRVSRAPDQLGGTGQIGVARFLDMPRRIARERVPTAFNVGSGDVTWASQPTPVIPFRVFSRVSRASHSLGKAGSPRRNGLRPGLRGQAQQLLRSQGREPGVN